MSWFIRVIALSISCFSNAPSWAETMYVIDKLLVGMHKEKSLDSPIVKLFPTGTQLDILKREEKLAYVRSPNGEEGWVDTAYLSAEQPARKVVEQLEKRNQELELQLKSVQEKGRPLVTGPASELSKQFDALKLENESLKKQLESNSATEAAPGAETQALQEEISRLKSQLDEASSGGHVSPASTTTIFGIDYKYYLALIAGILALSFYAGAYWKDSRLRKRYGGFRIRI